jgi:hypothetical protein
VLCRGRRARTLKARPHLQRVSAEGAVGARRKEGFLHEEWSRAVPHVCRMASRGAHQRPVGR